MRKLLFHCGVALLLCATGCKKEEAPSAPSKADAAPADAPALSGSDAVRAALEKKDWDGAMSGLLQVGQSVTSQEQQNNFLVLKQEVKNTLMDASATDPKAAQALTVLRQMTVTR